MCRASIRVAMRLGAEVVLIWKWQGSAWRTSEAARPVVSLQWHQRRAACHGGLGIGNSKGGEGEEIRNGPMHGCCCCCCCRLRHRLKTDAESPDSALGKGKSVAGRRLT